MEEGLRLHWTLLYLAVTHPLPDLLTRWTVVYLSSVTGKDWRLMMHRLNYTRL